MVDAVRGAKDTAPTPIAVEVVRLWADLGARERMTRYRASVKIAYHETIVAPDRAPQHTSEARTRSTRRRGD